MVKHIEEIKSTKSQVKEFCSKKSNDPDTEDLPHRTAFWPWLRVHKWCKDVIIHKSQDTVHVCQQKNCCTKKVDILCVFSFILILMTVKQHYLIYNKVILYQWGNSDLFANIWCEEDFCLLCFCSRIFCTFSSTWNKMCSFKTWHQITGLIADS